jgi:hypothetical protein
MFIKNGDSQPANPLPGLPENTNVEKTAERLDDLKRKLETDQGKKDENDAN